VSIRHYLETQLKQIYPEIYHDLRLGKYHFRGGNNHALLFKILSSTERKTDKILSYKNFQNFFNPALSAKKPTKPNRDDPAYHDLTRKAIYSPQKYFVYQIWRYEKDRKKYHQALINQQKQAEYLRFILQNYTHDSRGYIRFVYDNLSHDEKAFFLKIQTYRMSEQARQRHSYITGQSGSGKTELLKTMIHHYLTQNTDTGVILLDPHGDIAEQVAQFQENSDNDRLVYIDPFLSNDHIPVLNPFQLPHKNTPYRIIDRITEELYLVLKSILQTGFTPQMETLLRPCITTLLLMGDKDISDLQHFMDDNRNGEYVEFALKHLYNPAQVDFLEQDFHKEAYNPTKQAIKTKLQSLLNSNTFRQLLTGKPSFNLDQLSKDKKVIIFNLSAGRLGNSTSDVIGRFILAQIQSIAFQRVDIPAEQRPHTHIFIDECQRYISPSIETLLTESRKYKFFLTLANQYYGQKMGTEIKNAITNNTAIKIAGKNGDKNATTHHKETGADINELKNLKVGEFHIKEDVNDSVKIKAPDTLIGDKNAMNPQQWKITKQTMIKKYYHEMSLNKTDTEFYRKKHRKDKSAKNNQKNKNDMTPKNTDINPKFKIEF
jgi:chromosomal replication initiation ATPase DnaA